MKKEREVRQFDLDPSNVTDIKDNLFYLLTIRTLTSKTILKPLFQSPKVTFNRSYILSLFCHRKERDDNIRSKVFEIRFTYCLLNGQCRVSKHLKPNTVSNTAKETVIHGCRGDYGLKHFYVRRRFFVFTICVSR